MTKSTKRRTAKPYGLLLLLFGLPLLLVIAKSPASPVATVLSDFVSLAALPAKLQSRLGHILFVPLGATLVVFVRLTLGLRVLGPFRSILLAVAFQITGIGLGLIFLASTIAIYVGIRPSVRSLGLPYFGRITVMLSIVAALMTLAVMAGGWFHSSLLQTVVYFPMVVLCLVADAFARTMKREGISSALWRATMTALVAVVLAALAKLPWTRRMLLHYPELLIAQIGGIIVVSRFMAWRLLERFNLQVGNDEEDEFEMMEELAGTTSSGFATARTGLTAPSETAGDGEDSIDARGRPAYVGDMVPAAGDIVPAADSPASIEFTGGRVPIRQCFEAE